MCLVFEEAYSLVPEWTSVADEGDKSATNRTARAILQGRKYGMGCLLITQRTANVTKTILNQCNSIFVMRTFDDTGKAFLANYIGTGATSIAAIAFGRNSIGYELESEFASTIERTLLSESNCNFRCDEFKAKTRVLEISNLKPWV